ncbi:MAG: thiol:disulfide interchange protein DsbA/DsbL [Proteobacteria bacterium]|uniref:Thiol:disulfide interchange protein n=1 Tax=Candidatus Avisuccinivibrio stercorigallinarum TaxID=2840704 RepID=A0A9D9DCI5_9GAMM|nr:thiol:disulfide interchange protein DsbA/DsbL [Candidatus Avisuccinivibrio stercorigallinarum]
MFKKLAFVLLSAAVFTLSAGSAAAVEYKEGVNYQIRAEKALDHKEIREFFSFWCGHCFGLQSTFHKIEAHFKGQAEYVKNPVGLLGGAMGPLSQQAFAAAKMLNLDAEFTAGLFDEMHVQGKIPHSEKDFAAFFGRELGIPEDKFERDLRSFPVAGMVSDYDAAVDKYQIDAVPELLVNGRYLVTMESVNSEDELIDLIAYLLTLN